MTAQGLDAARIVGVYTTEQRRSLAPRTGFSLALESLQGALADAGMTIADIDAVYSWISDWPVGVPPRYDAIYWSGQLGHPLRWHGADHGIAAILDAAAAIGSGLAETAAIVVGMVKPPSTSTAPWTRRDYEFSTWTGSYTAAQYGLVARRYMHEYGDTALEAMALVSATVRNFGNINPDALYFGRGALTPAQVLESRPVASPLTLLMCCSVNDGGCAMIVTTRERARDTLKRPVRILAGGMQVAYPWYSEAPVLRPLPDESRFARDVFARAGIAPADIDMAQLHDNFAVGLLLEYELYGFCDPGEAGAFVMSGAAGLRGGLPTCTDGGLLAYSHNGLPTLFKPIEAVRQMRNEVHDLCPRWADGIHTYDPELCRKVENASIALVANGTSPTASGNIAILAVD